MYAPKDLNSSLAISGLFLAFAGIPVLALPIIAIGFLLVGIAIARWWWEIMTS